MLDVHDLTFTYPHNSAPALKGMNFMISKGEIFGFLGPSGAGKSTVQKILIGVLKQYDGTVRVMNNEMSKVDAAFYEQLGVAFEVPNFYQKFTAMENLKFFHSFYDTKGTEESPERLLHELGLQDAANTKVAEFSKGMKIRLNICRAFLHDPQLVFLDEPTSGLDPVNVRKVLAFISKKRDEGKTVVINTHNMEVADAMCDRVAFIVDGEIKLIDSPLELKLKHSQKQVTVQYKVSDERKYASFALSELAGSESFHRLLREAELEAIHTQEKTLEDLFIDVTGRRLDI